ncbi:hypothetical protein [Methylobacterium sp. D54C]|jgi:hypothetical protein
MVAYSLEKQFGPPILTGAKSQTNRGVTHAERTIRGAPLPRAYHGTARDAVLAALTGSDETKERRP